MKTLCSILVGAMLMVGVAGNAMADFELGNTQLVAYVETDMREPVGSGGNEIHFDLGAGLFDLTMDIDTGITLADLGAASWDQVYVGIVGGGYDSGFGWTDALFSSDTADFTASTNVYSQYQSAILNISSFFGAQDAIQQKATGTYFNNMLLTGSAVGTYAGMVNANSPFGAEAQMNGDLVAASMYSFDGDGTGDIANVLDFSFDTTGSTLVLAAPVPVPGALLLMITGLLGMVGIKRRKA